jgi:hypothetical protein
MNEPIDLAPIQALIGRMQAYATTADDYSVVHVINNWADELETALAALASQRADSEQAKAEHTRAILHFTIKGYDAGENADAKHWRKRAEEAEAEIERLKALALAAGHPCDR